MRITCFPGEIRPGSGVSSDARWLQIKIGLLITGLWSLLLAGTPLAHAKERHWLGGSSQFWGDGNNWYVPDEFQAGVPPQDGDDLVFDTGEPDEDVDTSPMQNELPNLTVRSITFAGDNDTWTVNGNTVMVTERITTGDQSGHVTVHLNCPIKLGGALEIGANENWDQVVPINQNSFEMDLNGVINLNSNTLTVFAGGATLIHASSLISGTGHVIAKGTGAPGSRLGKVVFDGPAGNTFHGSLTVTAGWQNDGQYYQSTVHFNKQSGVVVTDRLRVEQMSILTLDRPEQIGDEALVEIDGRSSRASRDDGGNAGLFGVASQGTPQVAAGIDMNGQSETIGNLELVNYSSDSLPAFVFTGNGAVLSLQGVGLPDDTIQSEAGNTTAVPIIWGTLGLTGGSNPSAASALLRVINDQAGRASLIVRGGIVGSGNISSGVTGNGALILTGNSPSSLGGTWAVTESAVLEIHNSRALNGMTVELDQDGSLRLQNASISGSKLRAFGLTPIPSFNQSGSLFEAFGDCAWNGEIDLTFNLVVNADNLALNGPISGKGGIEFLNGTMLLGGKDTNTFTGSTFVHCSRLEFNKPVGVDAFSGALFVGGGSVPSEARWLSSYQNPGTALIVHSNGFANLNASKDLFATVLLYGGHVRSGVGELGVTEALSVSPNAITTLIEGTLDLLPARDVSFFVGDGPADPDLYINGTVIGATPNVVKQGAGTLRFGLPNTYTGVTRVEEGVLQIDDPASLGSTIAGTVVSSNATLRVGFSSGATAEPISLAGSGADGTQGSIQVINGATPTLAGFIHLDSASSIDVGPQATLSINGSIGGIGPLVKTGPGDLLFGGTLANTYSGNTLVTAGTLLLNKSTGITAVPGPLIIDTPAATVRHLTASGINGGVTVDHAGLWDLNGQTARFSIAALQGQPPLLLKNGGKVTMGSGMLVLPTGGDIVVSPGFASGSVITGRIGMDPGLHHLTVNGHNLSSTHGTELTVVGDISETSPVASLEKDGVGTLRLTGANSYSGATVLANGTLQVDGTQAQSPVQVQPGTRLLGAGIVGSIDFTGSSGVVQAGAGPGILTCGNFSAQATGSGVLSVQLNGPDPGIGYDQLDVHGTVNLSGIALNATLNFLPADTNQFVLIKNDGTDPVIGTFNGLPEATAVTLAGEQFVVSYTGGDGNDVVLRHLSALAVVAGVWVNPLGGDWNEPTNWDTQSVPGGSNATITNNGTYSITNNVDTSIARLFYGNPNCTLVGGGNLTLSDLFTWQGGSFSGSGTVNAQGGMHISGPASAGPKFFTTKTLLNTTAATWSDDGTIYFSGGATLSNATNATFDCAGDGTLENLPGTNLVINAGTFRKTGGTNTTRINVPFYNNGTVSVLSGNLSLNKGGTNTDTITVSSGATFTLGGGTFTSGLGSTITGSGNLVTGSGAEVTLAGLVDIAGPHLFGGGTVNIAGAYNCSDALAISGSTVNFNGTGTIAPQSLALSQFGTLGGTNVVTVTGPLTWDTASTISGSSLLFANGGVTILPGTVFLSGRTFVNTATAVWSNNAVGAIQMSDGAVLSNAPSGTFDCIGGGEIQNGPGTNLVVNDGLFRKTGDAAATDTTISVAFNNNANVDVQSGVLDLAGGGETTGSVTVSAGAGLSLGGAHDFSPASSITGAGDFSVLGGVANLAGLVEVSGTHTFNFGTANITGQYDCLGNVVNITGGTANFNGTGNIAPTNLTLNGFGVLGGSNPVTVNGPMTWGGSSSVSGTNNLVVNGPLNISGNVQLSGRTLVNNGLAVWTNNGPASLSLSDGAVLLNSAGAIFDCAFDGFLLNSVGANPFLNEGLFRKSAGTGTTIISVPFHNSGVIDARSGLLNFVGPLFIESGGSIQLNGGQVTNTLPMQLVGGSLHGNGLISGAVLNQGLVSPGFSPGRLIVSSDYTQNTNGTLNIEIAGTTPGAEFDQLIVSNAVALGGTLNVSFLNGFQPLPNSSFTFLTGANVQGAFATFNYPSNEIALGLNYSSNSVTLRVLNTRPSIAPITDMLISNHVPFRMAVQAADADSPAQSLTYRLLLAPPGMQMDTNGVITWTPDIAQVPTTEDVFVLVSDSGIPSLTTTQSFRVTIGAPATSVVSLLQFEIFGTQSNTLTFSGIPNSTYAALYATNLPGPWTILSTNVAGSNGLWSITDSPGIGASRFYRALWLFGP
jgi:autotransporter-associated beta strand protein